VTSGQPESQSGLDAAAVEPEVAGRLLGDQLPLMRRYAGWLGGDAVVRGLLGPREAPRLWDRHLLNCVVVGELLPVGAEIVDIGSGAGLPGLVLACARPDLSVVLVEPLLRRSMFLEEVVTDLGLQSQVTVLRGRADDPDIARRLRDSEWVTARAVAPLDRLATWCAPFLRSGGQLLAIKGAQAEVELAAAGKRLRSLSLSSRGVVECGVGVIDPPTRVVVLQRA
jgi:16S rRNA (guanine527-N7)-methyltransferase